MAFCSRPGYENCSILLLQLRQSISLCIIIPEALSGWQPWNRLSQQEPSTKMANQVTMDGRKRTLSHKKPQYKYNQGIVRNDSRTVLTIPAHFLNRTCYMTRWNYVSMLERDRIGTGWMCMGWIQVQLSQEWGCFKTKAHLLPLEANNASEN